MKHVTKIVLALIVGFTVFFHVMTVTPINAAPAGLYFNPGNSSVTQGQEFWVDIYGTTGANFGMPSTNVVVKYPSNLLTVVEVNKTGSALPGATLTSNPSQQTVSFTYSFFGSSAGIDNKKLFSVKFRPLIPGTALLDFTSYFLGGNTVAKNASSYTIVAPTCPIGQVGTPPNCTTPPPATCPSGQVGTPPNCTTPVTPTPTPTPTPPAPSTPAPKPTPTPTPTPASTTPNTSVPVVEEKKDTKTADALSVEDLKILTSYDTADVSWLTNVSSDSKFEYGTNSEQLDNQATVQPDKDATSFSVKLTKLKPGIRYFYAITTTAKDGASTTEKGSLTTKAYPVLLRITHQNKPLQGGKIALKGYRESYTTNSKGEASLALIPGNYKIQITKDTISEEQAFTVKQLAFKSGATPDTQIITIAISGADATSSGTNPLLMIIFGAVLLSLLIAGALAALLWKKHRTKQDDLGYQSFIEDTPPVGPEPVSQDFGVQTAYQAPVDYAFPTTTPVEPLYPATTVPMESGYPASNQPTANTLDIQEPSEDIWSATPQSTNSEQPLQDDSPSVTPSIGYETIMPPAEPNPYVQVQPLQQVTPLEPEVEIQAQEESPRIAPSAAEQSTEATHSYEEEAYEYNEDNSMTIHHTN